MWVVIEETNEYFYGWRTKVVAMNPKTALHFTEESAREYATARTRELARLDEQGRIGIAQVQYV